MLKTVHQRCVMRMRMSTMDVRMRLGGGIQYSEFSNGVRYVLWGCVVGDNTGLEFREVASKGPLDALIRELCKIT